MPFKSIKTEVIIFSVDETIFNNVGAGKDKKISQHGFYLAQSNESDTHPSLGNFQGKQMHQPQRMSDFPDWCAFDLMSNKVAPTNQKASSFQQLVIQFVVNRL